MREQSAPLDHLGTLRPGARLSEQLAESIAAAIRNGRIATAARLPPESALVERFGVSRTVVREALTRLKSLGLVESRQGSGVYVRADAHVAPLRFEVKRGNAMATLLQIIEMRRALEAEAAGLAAARRSAADVRRIRSSVAAIERAVAAGGDGVLEDVAFHRAVAAAADNPFLTATLEYLGQFLRDATRVTRANEATRADLAEQVRDEHGAIVEAIAAGDVACARRAGALHMANAARRIGSADASFWASHGKHLADRLATDLGLATARRA